MGGAPDTFLGPGMKTAVRAIAAGHRPAAVRETLMQSIGPERCHPSPEFFFNPGVGPLFDIGPYYLTALVQLFGPVRASPRSARRARPPGRPGRGPGRHRLRRPRPHPRVGFC